MSTLWSRLFLAQIALLLLRMVLVTRINRWRAWPAAPGPATEIVEPKRTVLIKVETPTGVLGGRKRALRVHP